jgi:hypothetical protein
MARVFSAPEGPRHSAGSISTAGKCTGFSGPHESAAHQDDKLFLREF